jgi:gas vesicle protein
MQEQEQTFTSFGLFLLGCAAGVAAGILLAPRSGQDTRRRLQDWAEDVGEKGQNLWERGKNTVQRNKERGREALSEAQEKGKDLLHDGQEFLQRQ